VPAAGEQHVLAAVLIDPPAGPAAAVLIDPQVRHQRRRLLQDRIGLPGERLTGHRPRHVLPPGRLSHRATPPGHLRARQPAQPLRQPAPGRHGLQRLGGHLPMVGNFGNELVGLLRVAHVM
jgi:hypothetical protein